MLTPAQPPADMQRTLIARTERLDLALENAAESDGANPIPDADLVLTDFFVSEDMLHYTARSLANQAVSSQA